MENAKMIKYYQLLHNWRFKMANTENTYVVKHNKLIEAKTKMTFTAIEQKLFLTVVAKIEMKEEKLKRKYVIDLHDFFELNGNQTVGGSQWNSIEEAVVRLQDKKLKLRRYDDDGYFISRLITGASFLKNTSKLEVSFYEDLAPYLLELKEQFTRYQLRNVMRLKSSDAIVLYELLKQYETIGVRTFKIIELRDYLNASDTYKRFNNFKARKIEKSISDINKNTDIKIEVKYLKKGRKITEIKFLINKKNEDLNAQIINGLYTKEEIQNLKKNCGLTNINISDKQLFELYEIANKKVDHIAEVNVYNYFKLHVAYVTEKNPKSFIAYLRKSLKDDYANMILLLKYKDKI
jgi:plasmid replication initiation protein